MFKQVELQTNDVALRGAWDQLIAWIQRRIEAMQMIKVGGTLVRGEIVTMAPGADRSVILADASAAATAQYVGVSTQPVALNGLGIIRNDNRAFVLFTGGGGAPTGGDDAYVSDTPGRADVVPGTFSMKLGKVVDGSGFAQTGGAYVLLNKCCTPLAG